LVKLNEEFLYGGKIEQEFEKALSGKSDEEQIAWTQQRCGRSWNQREFDEFDGDPREALLDQGRRMLKWELVRLEQYILLRIYDQAWKDHLLEMDHLKSAIMQRPLGGDQTHPQSQYAIEGRDLFAQMWARIAGRVTDLVFKVQAGGGGEQATTGTSGPALSLAHASATGAGFANADQAAAMKAQGQEAKAQTIRREEPKVGRNDPCPCGSGKKYKNCHGKR
jgi:preprotein translocase subunit SecA